MSFEKYDVYFSGNLLKDKDPQQVRQQIGSLFKLDGAHLDQLFSGKPVAIKKGVDMERAVKYRVAFRDAGALLDICPAGTKPQAPPARRKAPLKLALEPVIATPSGAAPSARQQQTLNEGATTLSATKEYDLSDCAPEVEAQHIPDISAMDMDQPGAILDSTLPSPDLEIDTSELVLDQPGVTLIEEKEAEQAAIDISGLALSPAKQGSLEEFQQTPEAEEIPSIDHLHLEQADDDEKQES